MNSIDPQTQLIAHPYLAPAGFDAPQIGVYKASTVYFKDAAAMRARDWRHKTGYTYGLHGTPTTFVLEERIASLENGKFCVLTPSGLSAIVCVDLALLQAGDELLLPHNVYGARLALTQEELKRFGIFTKFYDAMDAQDLAAKITAQTRLVWLEAPGSVTMEFPDLPALLRICKEAEVTTALDNTWGGGLAFNAFDVDGRGQGLGADLSIQALTKYASGGADVLMGSIVTQDEALHEKIKLSHMRQGLGVAGNDAELILRSLPSMRLRYMTADESARKIAAWLKNRPEVEAVLHPALQGAPGHENWLKLTRFSTLKNEKPTADIAKAAIENRANKNLDSPQSLAAGLFSIVFQAHYSQLQIDAFVNALKLFKIGFSWGGPVSLAVPYDVDSMRPASVSHWSYRGGLVRLSIGLEATEDLIADLEQGLPALKNTPKSVQPKSP